MNERDAELLRITREFLKGCSCAPPGRPYECSDCTEAFAKAAIDSEFKHGAKCGPGSGELDSNVIPIWD
ncbi:hypothetical protein GOC60_17045 [Sinorhizobium meliloti]|nr:hypothetical protein [Sinorhizobium meliloti]MDX0350171.1 hypothetical protein [Sinorhizobium meliloti]